MLISLFAVFRFTLNYCCYCFRFAHSAFALSIHLHSPKRFTFITGIAMHFRIPFRMLFLAQFTFDFSLFVLLFRLETVHCIYIKYSAQINEQKIKNNGNNKQNCKKAGNRPLASANLKTFNKCLL